jgi:hypothetical protein
MKLKYARNIVDRLHISFGDVEPENYTRRYRIREEGFAESAVSHLTFDRFVEGYDEAVKLIDDFYKNCNEDTGYVITVWIED